MLARPCVRPCAAAGWAGEPKWDGFRAGASVDAGQVVLRSKRGTDMAPAFPEVVAGAAQLPDATALDGELVVWDAAGRLAFERLQNRLARRGAGAARAAEKWPTHFVAFDLLRLSRTDTTGCWWWKSASTSPATPPADGATPHAGTAPAPTSPPPMSPA
ncbi:ATP-dependent DNA ligase [Streptomyces mirabilis]|uniref:ATP-dependent DNA ligase n=1 Tax=Streptomyces mirabilis TaxID=68239 RepID=UPI0033AAE75C